LAGTRAYAIIKKAKKGKGKMKIFAIADLHLGFNTEKPMDVFGPLWDEHPAKIKSHWEKLITDCDLVLIPGDISWAMRQNQADVDLKWLDDLPGKKICTRGNHDYWWDRPTKLNKAYETITFLQNTAYLLGKTAICGCRGWELILQGDKEADEEQKRMIRREADRLKLSLEAAIKADASDIWVMMHYPPVAMGEDTSAFLELMQAYPVTKVIYGHLHDPLSWQNTKKGLHDGIIYHLVAADYLNFKPRLIETIMDKSIPEIIIDGE